MFKKSLITRTNKASLNNALFNRVRIAIFTGTTLLVSLISATTFIAPANAASACSTSYSSGNLTVEPSHGSVFFIDTGVNPRIDASYVGYRIKNTTGSSLTNSWVSLSNFSGGIIGLANQSDEYQKLPTLANNATGTVYFLLKATASTKAAQIHDVKVFLTKPNSVGASAAHTCSYSFTRVAETIKAAANKVTSMTVNDSTPELGQLITVTVKGQTGTIGSGPADIGKILWFSPASFSNFPTQALRLESVILETGENPTLSGKTRTYSERLFINSTITPDPGSGETTADNLSQANGNPDKRYYENQYLFRVVGRAPSVGFFPVAQISSGTQIKHTALDATSTLSLDTSSALPSLAVTKSVVSTSGLSSGSGDYVNYFEVPYKITLTRSGSTTFSIDEVVDFPDDSVIFKSGTARLNSSTVLADPVKLDSEASLNPRPLHFVGPFTISATNTEITYTMYVPKVTGTYPNTAGAYIGKQLIGASASAISKVTLTTDGSSVTGANTTTETITPTVSTLPATEIGTTSAVLNGSVDANGNISSITFEFSTNSSFSTYSNSSTSSGQNPTRVSDDQAILYTSNFSGTSGTRYYYRIVSTVGSTRYEGEILSFFLIEPASTPEVVTLDASSVSTTSATLNGTIDPNLQAITDIIFTWSLNSDLSSASTKTLFELDEGGSDTAVKQTASGANPIEFSHSLTGLTNNNLYYFKISAVYSTGTISGLTKSFRTGSTSQTITFNTPNDDSYSDGSFNLDTSKTSGTTAGTAWSSSGLSLTFTSESTSVCTVSGSVITYVAIGYCVITASQGGNTTYAPAAPVTRQFQILESAPTATTSAASSISATTATLHGSVTTGGAASTTVTFEYSQNSDLTGSTSTSAATSPLSSNGSVSKALTGLTPGTTYYFQVVATNSVGTARGTILNFSTPSLVSITITATTFSKNYLASAPTFVATLTAGTLSGEDTITGYTLTFTNKAGTEAYGPSITAPTQAGTYIITPSSATISPGGAGNYGITYVAGEYTISKIDQAALNLGNISLQQNSTYTLAASGGSGTGLVTYSVTAGTCTVSGAVISTKGINEGCSVEATKASDRNYNVISTTASVFVTSLQNQTITFDDTTDRTMAQSTTLIFAPTASSNLAVTLLSTTTDVCTVSGFTVTILKSGECSLTASQAGNGSYNPAADVIQSFLISKVDQTITFDDTSDLTYTSGLTLTFAPTASSNLTVVLVSNSATSPTICTVSGFIVSIFRSGTCSLTASQPGNSIYNVAANVSQSFEISKRNERSLAIKNKTVYATSYDPAGYESWGNTPPVIKSDATLDNEDPKTYSLLAGSTGCSIDDTGNVVFTGPGTCKVKAITTGPRYNDADDTVEFTIGKKPQSINFTNPNNVEVGAGDQDLPASTNESENIVYSVLDSTICEIVGSAGNYKVRSKAAGNCQVTASSPETSSLRAPTSVIRTFAVTSPAPSGSSGGGSNRRPTQPVVPVQPLPPIEPINTNLRTRTDIPKSQTVPGLGVSAEGRLTESAREIVANKANIEIKNGVVSVTPLNGWTGKVIVPVMSIKDGQEVEVNVEITVDPLKPEVAKFTPVRPAESVISWDASKSQVIRYDVQLNGVNVCSVTTTSCSVPSLIGPKSEIEIKAIGNNDTFSEVLVPDYKPGLRVAALTVYFAENKSVLTKKAKQELDRIASIMQREGFTDLRLIGHTDGQSGSRNATNLSTQRGNVVQAYLARKLGAESQKVSVLKTPVGEKRPAASNATAKGQAKNRRTELWLR